VDEEIEAMGAPFRHASRLKVTTKEGRTFERLSLHRRGSPENPLSPQEIVDKFYAVVAPCMERGRAEKIVEIVDRLEKMDDVTDLINLVSTKAVVPA
jgi:2-methylcitrate dehydratase PrpD